MAGRINKLFEKFSSTAGIFGDIFNKHEAAEQKKGEGLTETQDMFSEENYGNDMPSLEPAEQTTANNSLMDSVKSGAAKLTAKAKSMAENYSSGGVFDDIFDAYENSTEEKTKFSEMKLKTEEELASQLSEIQEPTEYDEPQKNDIKTEEKTENKLFSAVKNSGIIARTADFFSTGEKKRDEREIYIKAKGVEKLTKEYTEEEIASMPAEGKDQLVMQKGLEVAQKEALDKRIAMRESKQPKGKVGTAVEEFFSTGEENAHEKAKPFMAEEKAKREAEAFAIEESMNKIAEKRVAAEIEDRKIEEKREKSEVGHQEELNIETEKAIKTDALKAKSTEYGEKYVGRNEQYQNAVDVTTEPNEEQPETKSFVQLNKEEMAELFPDVDISIREKHNMIPKGTEDAYYSELERKQIEAEQAKKQPEKTTQDEVDKMAEIEDEIVTLLSAKNKEINEAERGNHTETKPLDTDKVNDLVNKFNSDTDLDR